METGSGSGGGGDTGFEFVELETGQAGSATAYAINNAGIVVGVVNSFAGILERQRSSTDVSSPCPLTVLVTREQSMKRVKSSDPSWVSQPTGRTC